MAINREFSVNNHIKVLDGFRGIAILLVIFFHYQDEVRFGWMGVELFFMLSGFLITGKLLESVHHKNYYSSFYVKRILRIVPLYYAVLLFFFCVLHLVNKSFITTSFLDLKEIQIYYWTFSENFWEAKYGWPDNITIVHFWSLACEMQFYLIWPFIIKVLYKKSYWLITTLLILIVLAFLFRLFGKNFFDLHDIFRYTLLPSRIDAFAGGALLYVFIKNINSARLYKNCVLAIVFAVLLIIVSIIMFDLQWHYAENFVWTFGYFFDIIFWIGLIGYALIGSNWIIKFFELNVLQQLGKYSYGMYVFHLPTMILLSKLVSSPWQGLLAFTLTVLLSMLSYHFFEKYFIRLKSRT